jgi:hypothetical protein
MACSFAFLLADVDLRGVRSVSATEVDLRRQVAVRAHEMNATRVQIREQGGEGLWIFAEEPAMASYLSFPIAPSILGGGPSREESSECADVCFIGATSITLVTLYRGDRVRSKGRLNGRRYDEIAKANWELADVESETRLICDFVGLGARFTGRGCQIE